MAVSRPLILALIAAVLCAMTFYAATGAQRTTGVSSAAGQSATEAPAPAAEPPAAEPPAAEPPAPQRPEAPARQRDRSAAGDRARSDRGELDRSEGRRSERNRAEAPQRRETRAKPAPLPAELRVEGLPRPVARALAQRRTIVLFFRQGGSDDALTADAVDGVRGLRGVSVFAAPIQRLGRYSAVIGGLGLAQAPAVAVVGRERQARVVEGFVDPGTLRQLVLDVR